MPFFIFSFLFTFFIFGEFTEAALANLGGGFWRTMAKVDEKGGYWVQAKNFKTRSATAGPKMALPRTLGWQISCM